MEISDEIRKLYADHVAEISKREVSSSENFDKAVLTFSSAGLALSVGFLKGFVPIQSAVAPWTLYWSWALFTTATCATIVSFLVSSQALEMQKGRAYAYYIQGNDDALERGNAWDRVTRVLNYTSGGSFLLAMVLSVVFISINLEKGSAMKDENNQKPDGNTELLKKGLTVPTMQQVQRPPAQPPSGQTAPAPAPAPGSK
jgi:hypothetical protein